MLMEYVKINKIKNMIEGVKRLKNKIKKGKIKDIIAYL
jgi:hypothetical protein